MQTPLGTIIGIAAAAAGEGIRTLCNANSFTMDCRSVLGSWVGVRRRFHLFLFLTASRMVLPQDPGTDPQLCAMDCSGVAGAGKLLGGSPGSYTMGVYSYSNYKAALTLVKVGDPGVKTASCVEFATARLEQNLRPALCGAYS